MEFRAVNNEDRDNLIEFCVELNFSRVAKLTEEERKLYFTTLLGQITSSDHTSTYIAIDENKVIGLVSIHWLPYFIFGGSEGYISELFVLEQYRGHSVGNTLMKLVEDEAIAKNCIRLNLLNSRDKESYSRNFYSKLGFNERENFANFVKNVQDV